MRWLKHLLLAFVVVPAVEIVVLIKVGGLIGALPTVLLLLVMGLVGGLVWRFQGLYTWFRVREALARGQMPTIEMLEGGALLVAGTLFVIPGFVSDIVGVLLLMPFIRRPLLRWLLRRLGLTRRPGPPAGGAGPNVIEGEFRRDD